MIPTKTLLCGTAGVHLGAKVIADQYIANWSSNVVSWASLLAGTFPRVVFTGHSLGAMTAGILALHCTHALEANLDKIMLTTFGCPRWIDDEDCRLTIHNFISAVRSELYFGETWTDPISNLPPSINQLEWYRVGKEEYVNMNADFADRMLTELLSHSMTIATGMVSKLSPQLANYIATPLGTWTVGAQMMYRPTQNVKYTSELRSGRRTQLGRRVKMREMEAYENNLSAETINKLAEAKAKSSFFPGAVQMHYLSTYKYACASTSMN